jgi:hypothetical protein
VNLFAQNQQYIKEKKSGESKKLSLEAKGETTKSVWEVSRGKKRRGI